MYEGVDYVYRSASVRPTRSTGPDDTAVRSWPLTHRHPRAVAMKQSASRLALPSESDVDGWLDLGRRPETPSVAPVAGAAAAGPAGGPAPAGPAREQDFELLDEDEVADYIPDLAAGQREAWRNRVRQVYVHRARAARFGCWAAERGPLTSWSGGRRRCPGGTASWTTGGRRIPCSR